ncbi:MAG: cyclic nucleotide-binding domain-containing protein [Deltaproteobacteria bacterium]|nr:cyclic nucleotide-binding domain-containing protein [Deltaproteobacteria bacterium]
MKLRELEKRLREEPDNLGLRISVAGALREAGRQDEAVELYRSVAIAYRDQGRTQQAIACCRSILEIAPEDVRCHALLAALIAGHKGRTAARDTGKIELLTSGEPIVLEVVPPVVPAAPVVPAVPVRARNDSSSGLKEPLRRSSFPDAEPTPLPEALPYHVHDPTTRSLKKLSMRDLGRPVPEPDPLATPDPDLPAAEGVQTRPGSDDGTRPEVSGIASAARRISASLIASTDVDGLYRPSAPQDLAAELDTRQHRRIAAEDMAKISLPPPTVPIDLVDLELEIEGTGREVDVDTDADVEALTPIPVAPARGSVADGIPMRDSVSDEELTQPRDVPLGVSATSPATAPPPLLASAFFLPVPSDRRGAVLTRFQRRAVASGTTVIRQGESNQALIVVARGRLEVRHEREARFIALSIVGAGEYVGEVALLARAAAAAHVVAVTDAELLLLAPRDFYELTGTFPSLWAELKDTAERRTREHEARLRR